MAMPMIAREYQVGPASHITTAPASLWKQGEEEVGRGTAITLSQWERAGMRDFAACNAPQGLAASANGQDTEAAPSTRR